MGSGGRRGGGGAGSSSHSSANSGQQRPQRQQQAAAAAEMWAQRATCADPTGFPLVLPACPACPGRPWATPTQIFGPVRALVTGGRGGACGALRVLSGGAGEAKSQKCARVNSMGAHRQASWRSQ